MNPFSKVGVWILITAAAVLPLYELADYTEVWTHDGDVVVPAIVFLFAGMAFLSGKLTLSSVLAVGNRIVRIGIQYIRRLFASAFDYFYKLVSSSSPATRPTLISCDLRI